jgi:uncharacterized protein (DUF58 family)
MPRPTGRGFALLGLAAGAYVAGRMVGTWELYLFAFAFLATVIVSWLLVIATGRRIQVSRAVAPERPVAGDEPEFTFVVKNASLLLGPQLTLRSPMAGLSAEDLELEIESLAPRRSKVLKTHTGRVNRGVHLLPPVQAVAEDPLGIASAGHRVSDPLPVTVYPRVAFLESCALYPDMGLKHDWSGQHGLLTPGASEFRGIRPHQPGEPLSHIDWKSTAKTGILMLREMEEPAGADVTILLDGTAGQLLGQPPDTNFELAVRAAGSIADFALRAGRRGRAALSLGGFGRGATERLDPAGRRAAPPARRGLPSTSRPKLDSGQPFTRSSFGARAHRPTGGWSAAGASLCGGRVVCRGGGRGRLPISSRTTNPGHCRRRERRRGALGPGGARRALQGGGRRAPHRGPSLAAFAVLRGHPLFDPQPRRQLGADAFAVARRSPEQDRRPVMKS